MKSNLIKAKMVFLGAMVISILPLCAQDDEENSPFSAGADFVSSYVWRGSKIGNGPNIQPSLTFTTGNFTLGAWGSFGFQDANDIAEADLYASYSFDFGLSAGITDYYYQGYPEFRYKTDSASHAIEVNLGYSLKSFSVSGNYIINDASNGGPANKPGGGDMYFEADYSFRYFTAFAGAGNGWHSTDKSNGDDIFAVCNLGIKTTREIKITDTFSVPVTGLISVNPDREELNLVVGFTF